MASISSATLNSRSDVTVVVVGGTRNDVFSSFTMVVERLGRTPKGDDLNTVADSVVVVVTGILVAIVVVVVGALGFVTVVVDDTVVVIGSKIRRRTSVGKGGSFL